jgi:cytochrome P450
MAQDSGSVLAAITTPRGRGFVSALGSNPTVLALAASLGLALRRWVKKPLRFRKTVIAVTHDDVSQMLARDLDFRIAPINEQKIGEVNGPFILGMDRSPPLELERRALYSALAAVDLDKLEDGLRRRAKASLAKLPDRFDALQDFARPLAAGTASQLFGIAPKDQALFQEVARAIFAHTFLNLGDDKAIRARAMQAAPLMKEWFEKEIARRQKSSQLGEDLMGHLLRQKLLKADFEGVRRTLGGMLVGSIDTTVTCVSNILDVMFRNDGLRAAFRHELAAGRSGYGLCLEALRVLPHNPIVLREAHAATTLAGREVKANERVIAWTQAAMRDAAAFPEPKRLYPDRPLGSYLHFGAGLHPCAGRAVNAFQLPILVGALLEAGAVRAGKTGFAGPFPDRLPVRLMKDSA